MPFPPLLAEFDWSQVFYFLIPLVYVAAQFFGGDKEKKSKEAGKPTSPEAQDQLRKVQEEIRRKIAERQEEMRRAIEGDVDRPIARSPMEQETSAPEPSEPEWARERREAQPPPVRREPAPVAAQPVNSLERQLREQQEHLKKARQARAAAFAEVRSKETGRASPSRGRRQGRTGSTRDAVLSALGDPGSARTAIVLSEVLGPPRALRPFEDRV
jgi:hypothetical protein